MIAQISYKCTCVILTVLITLVRMEPGNTNSTKQDIQYFNFNPPAGTYHYGYIIKETGQFHFERRGPDNITYGCYGHTGNPGNPQITYYVADAHGYRVIPAHQPLQLFWQEQQTVRTELRQWSGLYLPRNCSEITQYHPVTVSGQEPAEQPSTDPPTTNMAAQIRTAEDKCYRLLQIPSEYRNLTESFRYPNMRHIQCLVRCIGIIGRFYSDEDGANFDVIYRKLYQGTDDAPTREQFDEEARACLKANPTAEVPLEVCERCYPVFKCFEKQFLKVLGKPADWV